MEKKCGNCIHWHKVRVPKSKSDIYKNGRCGLGYHDAEDIPDCRVYNDGTEAKAEKKESNDPVLDAARITGAEKGRFTSDPWSQWLKK